MSSIASTISNVLARIRNTMSRNTRSPKKKRTRRNKDTIYSPPSSPRIVKEFIDAANTNSAKIVKEKLFAKARKELLRPLSNGGKNKSRKYRKSKKNNKK
jgi:hypothetical protein